MCPHCGESIAADAEACPACGHFHANVACDLHMERSAVGQCVVCGMAICEECNHPQGRHFVCAEHARISLLSGWAQVYSAADDLDAELVRDNLAAEGIESRVLSQRDHYSFNVDVGQLNRVRVLVPAYEYNTASALLADHTDSHGEVTFACPACGEAYDAGSLTCNSCGAELPVRA